PRARERHARTPAGRRAVPAARRPAAAGRGQAASLPSAASARLDSRGSGSGPPPCGPAPTAAPGPSPRPPQPRGKPSASVSGLSLTDAHCRTGCGRSRCRVHRVSHRHHEGEQVLDVTIEAVRDRYHTLNVPLAYFDAPAGTQVPDSVLEAVSGYLLA